MDGRTAEDERILRLTERPPECLLMRAIWKDLGRPDLRTFDPVVSLSWLETWREPRALRPAGKIVRGPGWSLFIANAPVGCKLLEELPGGVLRVLPWTFEFASARRAFDMSAANLYLLDRPQRGRARRVKIETLAAAGAAKTLPGLHGHRLPSASAAETLAFNDRLREEISFLGRRYSATWEAGLASWPVILTRDVIAAPDGYGVMQRLLEGVAGLAYRETREALVVRLAYRRPSQSGAPSSLSMELEWMGRTDWPEFRQRIEAGFSAHSARVWPQGWMAPVGPERTSRRLVLSALSSLRQLGQGGLSHHALLKAHAELLVP